jgi:hypothetical protein
VLYKENFKKKLKEEKAKIYTISDSHFPHQTPFDMIGSRQEPHPQDEDQQMMNHFFD